MNRLALVCFSVGLIFLFARQPVHAQQTVGQPSGLQFDGLQELSDSLFSGWTESTPGATIGLFQGDRPVFEAAYGMAELRWNIPASGDTVYMLASVSKQFTAWAIASLAASGHLSLDDDIRKYVPEMHAFSPPLTIRQLLHHVSGLRDEFDLLGMAGWRMDDVIMHEHILQLAYGQTSLNFEPGSAYSYSNTGYSLLAEIVERVSGRSLGIWLQEEVFNPLGMSSTHLHDDYTKIVPHAAQGYEPNGDGGYREQHYVYENVGSTGVFSSVHDLATWAHALNRRQIGTSGAWDMLHTRGVLTNGDTLDYALGQSLNRLHGHARVAHSGWHRGFRTVLMRFPDDDLTIVVLANTNSLNPSDMAEQLMRHVFHPDADSISTYAGTYYSEDLGSTYELVSRNGRLMASHDRNSPFHLTWTGPDQFSTDAWYFDSVTFTRGDDGSVVGFEGTTSRARRVVFDRE